MQYHTQLIKHDPANKRYGDCWRTCIACLLDKSPEQVPHFLEGYTEGTLVEVYLERARAYLNQFGLTFINFPISGVGQSLTEVLDWAGTYTDSNRYMLTGTSEIGSAHVVVCQNNEIEHDPSGNGIVAPCLHPDGSEPMWWIGFIAKKV